MSTKRIIACILTLPFLFVVCFFAYAFLANDPGCGSAEPGACFGAGLLMMLIAPFAVIATPIAIILFILDLRDRSKSKLEPSP